MRCGVEIAAEGPSFWEQSLDCVEFDIAETCEDNFWGVNNTQFALDMCGERIQPTCNDRGPVVPREKI